MLNLFQFAGFTLPDRVSARHLFGSGLRVKSDHVTILHFAGGFLSLIEECCVRLFVSEFVCGGGWTEGVPSEGFIREGRAMLRALLEDLGQIPDMQVMTTWDRRLPVGLGLERFDSLNIIPVSGPDEELDVFRQLCREADATYVIAPELNDELSRRVAIAARSATESSREGIEPAPQNLNCSVEAIDLCGDKWALFEHMTRHAIPTIPTLQLKDCQVDDAIGWPRVIKLRLGAGSHAMQLVSSPADWETVLTTYASNSRNTEAIVQPFVPGLALSVGVIIDRAGAVHTLPLADQLIDPQQRFTYHGGRIPSNRWAGSIDALLHQVLPTIPGLYGYIGIDLLIPDEETGSALLVEINPRLTTSYVGYRQLCHDNLAALWLGESMPASTLRWRERHVEFNSAGECS